MPRLPLAHLIVLLALLPLAVGCGETSSPGAYAQVQSATSGQADSTSAVSAGVSEAAQPTAGEANSKKPAAVSQTPAASPPSPPAGIKDIDFDDLKFEMEKTDLFERSMLTPEIEALAGRRVRIRGYILPSFTQSGLTEFVLVRDNMECCFGPGAALFDCIIVQMLEGRSTDFSIRPVAVEGRFTIQEYKDFDGVVRAIYHLDGEKVE